MPAASAPVAHQDRRGRNDPLAGRAPSPRDGLVVRRALVAWLAVFGLMLQLAAIALHPATALPDGAAGVSPICHQLADGPGDDDGGRGHPDQAPRGACPFCSLHSHVALAVASPAPLAAPICIAAAPSAPKPFATSPLSRRPTDAAPRGPPIAA